MASKSPHNSSRILIAEDEKSIARALELKLSHEGFAVTCVSDGASALEVLKREKFDLILTDIVMPKVDGFGVLEGVKKQGITTPVIVMSSLSQKDDEKRVRELGAKDFFLKTDMPVSMIVDRVIQFLSH